MDVDRDDSDDLLENDDDAELIVDEEIQRRKL